MSTCLLGTGLTVGSFQHCAVANFLLFWRDQVHGKRMETPSWPTFCSRNLSQRSYKNRQMLWIANLRQLSVIQVLLFNKIITYCCLLMRQEHVQALVALSWADILWIPRPYPFQRRHCLVPSLYQLVTHPMYLYRVDFDNVMIIKTFNIFPIVYFTKDAKMGAQTQIFLSASSSINNKDSGEKFEVEYRSRYLYLLNCVVCRQILWQQQRVNPDGRGAWQRCKSLAMEWER